jgi:diguanylate cyclase (GGDEF)-like protein
MLNRLLRPVRESFSAKIIALVSASVIVSSSVVGIVSMRSTEEFLQEKTSEKFPSILNTSRSKVKIFYERQFNDLVRLSQAQTFSTNLGLLINQMNTGTPDTTVAEDLNKYLAIVHKKFPVYDELIVATRSGTVVTATHVSAVSEVNSMSDIFGELHDEAWLSPPRTEKDRRAVYQWLFIPIGVKGEDGNAFMIAKIDLSVIGHIFNDVRMGKGGDLYLMDSHGKYLTQPRFTETNLIGQTAMQVPTRDDGKMEIEERSSYDKRKVFSSIAQLEDTGWWVAYEEDYETAMEPVLDIQAKIWVFVIFIGVAFILAALKIVHSMMKPVLALKLGAERINDGLVGVQIPRGSNDEIGMMIDTFNEMAKTITLSKAELQYKNKILNSQNDQLQEMNQKLEELSITDGLTGLFNHRHFWNILNTELTRVNLYQGELALLLIDLDDFKRVNDQFGHSVGDLLLQQVAHTLKDTVRDTDIAARYGGEEFAILLPDTDKKGVEAVSEKMRQNVEKLRFKVPETDITTSVTISVGVSVFKGNRREFFNAADQALYISKSEGKNRVHYAVTA